MHVIGPVLSLASHLLRPSAHQNQATSGAGFNDTFTLKEQTVVSSKDEEFRELSAHLVNYAKTVYPDEPEGAFQLREHGNRYEILTPSGRVINLEPDSAQEMTARRLDDLTLDVRVNFNRGYLGWMMLEE